MAKIKITDDVYNIALPIANEFNLTIYEVEYKKEGTSMVLRVILDTFDDDSVISINDCENISRKLSDELDRLDMISGAYMLEVTSPGLDRPLKSQQDFERFNGKKIDIGLYKAVDGSKVITGTLTGYNDGNISILTDSNESTTITKEQIAWVKLAVVF